MQNAAPYGTDRTYGSVIVVRGGHEVLQSFCSCSCPLLFCAYQKFKINSQQHYGLAYVTALLLHCTCNLYYTSSSSSFFFFFFFFFADLLE
jgi:hypothetical protein